MATRISVSAPARINYLNLDASQVGRPKRSNSQLHTRQDSVVLYPESLAAPPTWLTQHLAQRNVKREVKSALQRIDKVG
jgi:hypothetical protein